jgi:Tfp pilus assembly PilM family ATPase
LLCLDFGFSALKALRLRKTKEAVELLAAKILPPILLENGPVTLGLPEDLWAKYAACAVCTDRTVTRMLNAPASGGNTADDMTRYLKEQFGLSDDYRFGAVRMAGGAPDRLLAVAMPESEIRTLLDAMKTGTPAACRLEISGVAALNGFLGSDICAGAKDTLCMIDAGARSIFISFIANGEPVLVRKTNTGGEILIDAVMRRFDVDRETASTIIAGESIDISSVMQEVLDFTFRQITLSRDYIERELNTRVTRLFLAGGLAVNAYWRTSLGELFGFRPEVWNPLERMRAPAGGLPPEIAGQGARFAAAAGSAARLWSRR